MPLALPVNDNPHAGRLTTAEAAERAARKLSRIREMAEVMQDLAACGACTRENVRLKAGLSDAEIDAYYEPARAMLRKGRQAAPEMAPEPVDISHLPDEAEAPVVPVRKRLTFADLCEAAAALLIIVGGTIATGYASAFAEFLRAGA